MSDPEIVKALGSHAFFRGLTEPQLAMLAECARKEAMAAGQFLSREKESADAFYLIQSGRVAIEVHTPSRGTVRIQTIGPGDIVGWSWVVPPHRWQFDARVIENVEALALDAACLRGKCAENHELGYQVLHRLVAVISERLSCTRLQLLDVYK